MWQNVETFNGIEHFCKPPQNVRSNYRRIGQKEASANKVAKSNWKFKKKNNNLEEMLI